MDNEKLSLQLNSVMEKLDFNRINADRTSFLIGNFAEILNAQLKDKCLYGKVAVFSYQKTFLALANELKESLADNKILSMEYLFNEKDDLSVENLSKLFLLPDTIRAVIVLDAGLSNIGGYFASVKKLPLFIFTCGINTGEAVEDTFYVKNGLQYDLFTVTAKKYVIIDANLKNKLKIPYSVGFDYVLNNLLPLIDGKTNAYFTGKAVKAEFYNEKNRAVVEAFSCTKKPENERFINLFTSSVTCGMVNSILGEEYLKNNSLINFSFCYGKEPSVAKEIMLYATVKIMDLLATLINADCDKLFLIKDYNNVAENLSKKAEIKQELLLDNMFNQSKNLHLNGKGINGFADKFGDEITALSTSLKKINSIHLALGGKELNKNINKSKFIFALKYAGAMSQNISGLSLFIHSGINELF